MWKAAVSSAQSARKKRYCRIMGWVFSHGVGRLAESGSAVLLKRLDADVLLRLDDEDSVAGGGVSGSTGDDGVAFSIRAQVR